MAILEAFGLTSKIEKLVGGNVYQHFNILTMQTDLHLLFDGLKLWLEEVIGVVSKFASAKIFPHAHARLRKIPTPSVSWPTRS